MLSQTMQRPGVPVAIPRDAALLRELVGGPGGLTDAEFDALLVDWAPTDGVVQHFLARGILDQTGARTINSVLKGYVKMRGPGLCALFRLPRADAFAPSAPAARTASIRPVREEALRIVPPLRPLSPVPPDIAPASAVTGSPVPSVERVHEDLAPVPPPRVIAAERPTLAEPADRRPPLHVQIARLRAEFASTRGRHGDSAADRGLLPGDRFGHYTLIRRLGESAHSLVFQAHHDVRRHDVALKLPRFDAPPRTLPRFAAQARIHARFVHAGVLPLLDAGGCNGAVYLAYADMDTIGIADHLARISGRIQAWTLAQLFVDVARVLDAAARVGIVHGDLTPANILMCQKDARVRLTDFGMRIPGAAPGPFTAPELARGGCQTVQTDMFSLGVTLRHAATGTAAPVALLQRRPDLPLALVSAIDRMTAPSPRERPASWDEAIAEVLAACPRVADSSLAGPRI